MGHFVEECWGLRGMMIGPLILGRLEYEACGTGAEVTFKWRGIPPLSTLGWYHTHPPRGELEPSHTDDVTMRSWVKAISRPFLCGIISGSEQACYCYYNQAYYGEAFKIGVKKIKSRLIGKNFIGWGKLWKI